MAEFQALALQLPPGPPVVGVTVGVVLGPTVGTVVGGVAPANWVVYFVKSQSFWVTLLQMPEVVLSARLQAGPG